MNGHTSLELRKRLKEHNREYDQFHKAWEEEKERRWQLFRDGGPRLADPTWNPPPFPGECLDMICGAKTRAGHPCKRIDLYRNGRCKFHGGMSTGPVTVEGKKRSALNGLQPKSKRSPLER